MKDFFELNRVIKLRIIMMFWEYSAIVPQEHQWPFTIIRIWVVL